MTLEEFYHYQEELFDSFCKAVIRNEGTDAHRELAARAKLETAMSALPYGELALLSTEDVYHPYSKTFSVYGNSVTIHDWSLGQALQCLTSQRRDVILLYYFLDYTEPQIGELLHMSAQAVNHRRSVALQRLKELMEGLEHE